ncbi:SGNH/GDSL hydrolase family protein [Sphingomonas hankookensis]|uniref:SGNH/GDSL hydrolase family protein n=1 Tax=Sphingomonas hankookensis TaxID=563996 RepID=UPI003D302A79
MPGAVSLALPAQPFRSAVSAAVAPLQSLFSRFFGGTADIRVMIVSDSKDVATGGGAGPQNLTGAINYNPAAAVALEMAQRGLVTSLGSSYSDGNVTSVGVARSTYDPRWSPLPADNSWSVRSDTTAGGRVYQALATAARMTFTPVEVFDTITIMLNRGSLSANLLIDVDGGAQQPLVPAGSTASGLIRFSVTVPRGAHTIGIQPTGNAIFWVGIEVSDSTTPTARIITLAASGWRASRTLASASWSETTNVYSPLNALLALKPDVAILPIGTNDMINAVPIEGASGAVAFLPAMREIIDALRAAGIFCVLATPDYFDPARCPVERQEAYRQAILALAASYAAPVIDMALLGSYAARRAAGDFYDGLHLTRQGSAKRGQFIGRQLLEWAAA